MSKKFLALAAASLMLAACNGSATGDIDVNVDTMSSSSAAMMDSSTGMDSSDSVSSMDADDMSSSSSSVAGVSTSAGVEVDTTVNY